MSFLNCLRILNFTRQPFQVDRPVSFILLAFGAVNEFFGFPKNSSSGDRQGIEMDTQNAIPVVEVSKAGQLVGYFCSYMMTIGL